MATRKRAILEAHSDLLRILAEQAFYAELAGEIPAHTKRQMINVFYRAHTSLLVNSKTVSPLYGWRRKTSLVKRLRRLDSEFIYTLACLIGFGLALFAAYLIA